MGNSIEGALVLCHTAGCVHGKLGKAGFLSLRFWGNN